MDRQEDIAYSACGIPHYVAGDVAELKGLTTASLHMVRSPEFFENAKDVRIKTRTQPRLVACFYQKGIIFPVAFFSGNLPGE